MTQSKRPRYRTYMLRCWEETVDRDDLAIWRFSLQDLASRERQGYTSLTALVIALQDELMAYPLKSHRTLAETSRSFYRWW